MAIESIQQTACPITVSAYSGGSLLRIHRRLPRSPRKLLAVRGPSAPLFHALLHEPLHTNERTPPQPQQSTQQSSLGQWTDLIQNEEMS